MNTALRRQVSDVIEDCHSDLNELADLLAEDYALWPVLTEIDDMRNKLRHIAQTIDLAEPRNATA